ncbi:MAG: dihydrofolate reductase [Nanoarchaeota archaeon]
MKLVLIAAMDENRGIGLEGKIPWHIPEDLKMFRTLTMAKPVIMGRSTFDSIYASLGKPLDGRINIVVTRNKDLRFPEEVIVSPNLGNAISKALAENAGETYIIGGQNLYEQTIDIADRLEITLVDGKYKADRHFPEIKESLWKMTGEKKKIGFSFRTYYRRT